MPNPAPLDRARVFTWAEVVKYDPSTYADPYDGYELIGWLWRPSPGSWRWTFTTNVTGRTYVQTAQFMPVYAEMQTGAS